MGYALLLVTRQKNTTTIFFFWDKGSNNEADYFTKHFPASYHRVKRSRYVRDKLNIVRDTKTNGCVISFDRDEKKNGGDTSKCIVCGRLQTSGPIKVSKFMTQKIKSENDSTTKTMTRSQRMGAAASRATTLPAGSARNAIKQRKKKQKKPPTFGGRYNTNPSQIGNVQRRAVGSHAPIDTINGML